MENDTYEDTLLGSGYIGGWPGMHPAGSRVIRNKTGDVVDVLPPAIEPALPPTPVAEEAPKDTIAQPESEAKE